MTSELSSSAQRVQDYLSAMGFSFTIIELSGSARTSLEAAGNVGCKVAQIAKSLVFKEKKTGKPVLVIASGANRVDVKKIKKATGLHLGIADGNFVKKTVGYAIGGIPPAGHNEPLPTLLDCDLKNHQTIWAAAGTPFALFQLTPVDLSALTKGQWIDLAEEK